MSQSDIQHRQRDYLFVIVVVCVVIVVSVVFVDIVVIVVFVVVKREGDSLEGYTKRSGRNRGRSPRYIEAEQLPVRQYLVSENASGCAYSKVLSFRQFSPST